MIYAKCDKCKVASPVDITRRQVEGFTGVWEYGVECPKCKHWSHSCFMNDMLELEQKAIQEAIDNRKQILTRKYHTKFLKFQNTIKLNLERRSQKANDSPK